MPDQKPPLSAEYLPETAALIGRDLGIAPLATEHNTDYGLLRQWLADAIDDMLQHQPDYLRWVLYRLDIDQHKAMSAFRQAKRSDTALQLADLVIARECQKVATRQWYRNRHNTHQLPDDRKHPRPMMPTLGERAR
ncbi:MAG: hypothetical protein IPL33_13215 [Sphingobacteriales bacterium]|nr:hypothetical protein [Sphingobacteriales bacterium]